jgi:hypothetical protein
MIKRYEPSDYEEIMTWFDKRKMQRIHEKTLSSVGYVVPNVCAVWIYGTDSDFCYLENLISNPDIEGKGKSIDILLDTALRAANMLGYKFCMSVTEHPGIVMRALKKGAKLQAKQTLITYQLN